MIRGGSRRRWPAVVLALPLLLASSGANAQAGLDLLREEARGLGELIATQRRLAELELEVGQATQAETALGDELARARAMLSERQRGLERARARTRARLRTLRGGQRRGLLILLLSSRSLNEYRQRRRAMAKALERDLAQLREFQTEIRRVSALAEQIATQERRGQALKSEVSRRRDELATVQGDQERTLAQLRRHGVAERLSRARGGARRRLAQLVRSLRSELRRAGSIRRLRGRLPHPVDGPVAVPFGTVREPPFGTVTLHPGCRYQVDPGTRVAAVFAGRVVFARSLPGYGNLVILDHGDKVHTLSAELAEVQVREGQSVGAGQTLGSVGGQGSARGPGLYFEVRLSGRPVDPTLWLRLRAAGDAHQDRERTR